MRYCLSGFNLYPKDGPQEFVLPHKSRILGVEYHYGCPRLVALITDCPVVMRRIWLFRNGSPIEMDIQRWTYLGSFYDDQAEFATFSAFEEPYEATEAAQGSLSTKE